MLFSHSHNTAESVDVKMRICAKNGEQIKLHIFSTLNGSNTNNNKAYVYKKELSKTVTTTMLKRKKILPKQKQYVKMQINGKVQKIIA